MSKKKKRKKQTPKNKKRRQGSPHPSYPKVNEAGAQEAWEPGAHLGLLEVWGRGGEGGKSGKEDVTPNNQIGRGKPHCGSQALGVAQPCL